MVKQCPKRLKTSPLARESQLAPVKGTPISQPKVLHLVLPAWKNRSPWQVLKRNAMLFFGLHVCYCIHMCKLIYIYIYKCIYIYIYTNIYIYIYEITYLFEYIYMIPYAWVCVHSIHCVWCVWCLCTYTCITLHVYDIRTWCIYIIVILLFT